MPRSISTTTMSDAMESARLNSGEHDDQPGDRRSDERVEVGHYVHVGAAHVETTAFAWTGPT